jgi:hypothetical protein
MSGAAWGFLLFFLALFVWSVISNIRDYLAWRADRNRRIDELLARLSPPTPEDPAHKKQYQHLRRAQQ